MFYSILRESGYFQLKEFYNHPISKKYKIIDSRLCFKFFYMSITPLFIVSVLFNSILIGLLGILFLVSIPIYIKYLKEKHYSINKYLKENVVDYFKDEKNLTNLYEELKKDPHFDNELLDNEIKILIGSLEDGSFESSILYLLDKWKRKKDETVIEDRKINRYQQFIKKVSGKEGAKNLNSSAYEKYL